MTSRDFCYWLQGYFEIHGNRPVREPESVYNLNDSQVDMIRKHLAMVFIHEIDPSIGPMFRTKIANVLRIATVHISDQQDILPAKRWRVGSE